MQCQCDAGRESSLTLLSDFDQSIAQDKSNLKQRKSMASADAALVCGLKVQVGCQDRQCVISDGDETLT